MFTAADELRLLARQLRAATAFRSQLEAIMSEANQAVSDLTNAITTAITRIDADFDELERQLAEAESISEADRAALAETVAGIRGQVERLSGIDPNPAFPAPPEPLPDPAPGT